MRRSPSLPLWSNRLGGTASALPLWIAAIATVGTLAVALTLRRNAAGTERTPTPPSPAQAVEDELPGPEGGVLAELNWLVGTWLDIQSNGDIHEMQWNRSYLRSMTGTMRSLLPGQEPKYTFLLLEEVDGEVRLHLRDFGRSAETLEGATEPITLKLSERGDRRVVFSREGRAFPISVELGVEDGKLKLTWGAYCELGGLYTGQSYGRRQ